MIKRYADIKMDVQFFDVSQAVAATTTIQVDLDVGTGWDAAILRLGRSTTTTPTSRRRMAISVFCTKRSLDDSYGTYNHEISDSTSDYYNIVYTWIALQWRGRSYLADSSTLTDTKQGPGTVDYIRINSAIINGTNIEIVFENLNTSASTIREEIHVTLFRYPQLETS